MDDISYRMVGKHQEKIVYGNTDSLYIGKYDYYVENTIKTGELKNDHGDSEIINYRFIDVNKYALYFDRLTVNDRGRLSYYEFHWTGVNWIEVEYYELATNPKYKNEKYDHKIVNNNFAEDLFEWYCYLNEDSHIESSIHLKNNIMKPNMKRWERSFWGVKINNMEIDVSTYCKSRKFLNDKVSIPIHFPSYLDEVPPKQHNYYGLVIQQPTHKEWCLRQFPFNIDKFNIEDVGSITVVNGYYKNVNNTISFVVLGIHNDYSLLINVDIYMIIRINYIWYMMLMTYLGPSEKKCYIGEKNIPWFNVSNVIVTGNKYLIRHNNHPDVDKYLHLLPF